MRQRAAPLRSKKHSREIRSLVEAEKRHAADGSMEEDYLNRWLDYVERYQPPVHTRFVEAIVAGTDGIRSFTRDESAADQAWLAERIRAADAVFLILQLIADGRDAAGFPPEPDWVKHQLNAAHREVFGRLTARINIGPDGPNALEFEDLSGDGGFDPESMTITLNRKFEQASSFFDGLLTVVHETVHEQQEHRRRGTSWVPTALRKWQRQITWNVAIKYIGPTGLLGALYRLQPVEADAFNSEAVVGLRLALRTGSRPPHESELGSRRRRR